MIIGRKFLNHSRYAHAIICSFVLFFCCGRADAQRFMVKPMKMEFAPRAGETIEKELQLRCTSEEPVGRLDVVLYDLSQNTDGSWMLLAADEADTKIMERSCREWIRLSSDNVVLGPLENSSINVTIDVPRFANGFYAAALIVERRPPEPEPGTVGILFRFLIPVFLEIQGRPVRQRIKLQDVSMDYRQQSEKLPATTLLKMAVSNEGRTYSKVKGHLKLLRFSNGRWRNVTTGQIDETGILPAVNLNLSSDIQRTLPSGKYKLDGTMYVDGRRIGVIDKEVDFESDPSITKVIEDTALTLDPMVLSISGAPGATRSTRLRVYNESDDPVNIEAFSSVPPVLASVALGELKGEDLCCAEWLKIMPEKFTLRGSGRQNIGVMLQMPTDGVIRPNYYSLLTLKATYADGQSAGQTTTLITVDNKRVEAGPAAQVMKMTLAADEASRYIVNAKFGNIGNVHYTPSCNAVVTDAPGMVVARSILSGDTNLMLPLETRDYSGVIDFSKVNPGTYYLNVVFEYAPGKSVSKEMPVSVTVNEDNERLVEIIKIAEEKAEPVEKTAKAEK